MNPRYIAYAKTHGRTPKKQLEYDREQYPGGCMCGFILWISKNLREFKKKHPECFIGPLISPDGQIVWTNFLKKSKITIDPNE